MLSKRKRGPSNNRSAKRHECDAKQAGNEDAAPKKDSATFLSLSAELRNTIYELALVQDRPIIVRHVLTEPALLTTSRQVREEASKIFWLRNCFTITIWDSYGTDFHAFGKWACLHENWDKAEKVDLDIYFRGSLRWHHLMDWCKRVHDTRPRTRFKTPIAYKDSSKLQTVLTSALDLTYSHRLSSWQTCLEALQAFRRTVDRFHKA